MKREGSNHIGITKQIIDLESDNNVIAFKRLDVQWEKYEYIAKANLIQIRTKAS